MDKNIDDKERIRKKYAVIMTRLVYGQMRFLASHLN